MSAATMNEMERLRKAAEILVEKNDAANEKNRELMAGLEKSRSELNAALEREQALSVWAERVYKWWGEESKTKLNLKEIEMIINEKPVQDSKQKSNCSDERPCIPCFIGKGECHDLTKRDLIKQAEALEELYDRASQYMTITRGSLLDEARNLRQQAEAQDD